ncbi:hypothetical protein [Comamonas testosteroni]|uniref:hypothetical protein n=1 Tax=Comamonas testosteroni TaxID=285 RepID=UPI0006BA0277|nr:hypothetical protein [Comamonas testosteroni]
MQDIISTLKNALQQAEAGLEVAVGRLAKDGTERGEFQPSEVLALAIVREALATPATCLHQIQEPAAAEQAAWHAGLDEGRAQAARPVVVPDDMPSTEANTKYGESYGVDWVYEGKTAAPAAVAWSMPAEPTEQMIEVLMAGEDRLRARHGDDLPKQRAKDRYRALLSLAATPAADALQLDFLPFSARSAIASRHGMKVTAEFNALVREVIAEYRARAVPSDIAAAAPVVLPEPVATLHCNDECYVWARASEAGQRMRFEQPIALFTEQQVRALLATGGQAQAVEPEGVHSDPYPKKCPITGRPYFMHLHHPEHGLIPTFGGPYDSYSMPYAEGEPTDPWHERELSVHRYDHDRGHWVEDESIPLRIIFEEALLELQEAAEAAPQAQADARDAEQERWMGIGKAIERACVDLPAGAEINIHLEKDAGTVTLSDCDGDEQENFPTDEGFAGVVNAAIDAAIAAAKGE